MLVFYDVDSARIQGVNYFLGQYLHQIRDSVFEGELSEAKLTRMKMGLKGKLDQNIDGALIFYRKTEPPKESVIVVSKVRNKDNRVLESCTIDAGKNSAPLFVQPVGAWKEKTALRKTIQSLTWRSLLRSIGLASAPNTRVH